MKVAIFHNAMDNIGGAEIVTLTLARELNADIYSTNIDKEKIEKMGFQDLSLQSIGRVPINAPFRQQEILRRFRQLRLLELPSIGKEKITNGKYDFYIIAGDWSMSAAVNHKPNLWYVFSPIREIWDLYEYTRRNTVPRFLRWPFDGWVQLNRHLNRKYIRHVDSVICISFNTRERIRKYLGLDAQIIYPPTETTKFYYGENGDYWLSVNRLITHKRVELQLELFKELPKERLIIVGSYEQSRHFRRYAKQIYATKPLNVEIRSWVDSKELVELYAHCRGFITTAKDEDFGMTVVEAMASGKPVIAPNEGGYRETVLDEITGRLIDELNVKNLKEAILQVGSCASQYKEACLKQAQKFDSKIFIKKIESHIQNGS